MDVFTTEQYQQDPIYYTQLMQKQANEWSAQQAQKQMDFQKYMSDTAHQREVADLHAAGLNPVLSAHTNGASTPSGASVNADTSGMSVVADLMSQLIAADTAKSIAAGRGGGYGGGPAYDGYYFKDGWARILEDIIEGATDMTARDAARWLGKKGREYFESDAFKQSGLYAFLTGNYGNYVDDKLDAAAAAAAQGSPIPPNNRQLPDPKSTWHKSDKFKKTYEKMTKTSARTK